MKKFLASFGLGLFVIASSPPVLAAQETVAGTMEQCLQAQTKARSDFAQTVTNLQKTSKSSARDQKLIDSFRKRLTRQHKITPDLQTLLDGNLNWQTTISDKLAAYFAAKKDVLDSFCTTDPAKLLSLLITHKTAQVAVDQVMIDYYSWIATNYESFKKLFPIFYQRKIKKWFSVDKAEIAKELVGLQEELEKLKKEPATFG